MHNSPCKHWWLKFPPEPASTDFRREIAKNDKWKNINKNMSVFYFFFFKNDLWNSESLVWRRDHFRQAFDRVQENSWISKHFYMYKKFDKF